MQYAAAVGEYLSVPSGRRPVDERSTRQRVKVEVFVSVEDRVHALEVEMDDGGHELMPYRKASVYGVRGAGYGVKDVHGQRL